MLVLFGSVARREARDFSDIDLLVVAEGFPRSLRERRRPLLESWERTRNARSLPAVTWNLVTKSPDEARAAIGPQDLFDEADARRAMDNLEFVARLCEKLPAEFPAF